MIDTGPSGGSAAVGGLLRKLGVKELEAVFITHPHKDHVGNLGDVLAYAACPVVYTTPADYGNATEKMEETASANGVPIQTLSPGETVALSGVAFTALGPNGRFAEENDNSLVLMVQWGSFKALFAADQLAAAEAALLNAGFSPDCDLMKVGHHGEPDASSEAFVAAASPRFCIVTTSADPDEAPGKDVLKRLERAGAETFVLGETGTLRFDADGAKMSAAAPSGPPAGLTIREKDTEAEFVEIANDTGGDVDLTGWSLFSDKGNQTFFFPDGFTLKRGQSVRVHSGVDRAPDGLHWTEQKIWKNKKDDAAALLDPFGRAAARK